MNLLEQLYKLSRKFKKIYQEYDSYQKLSEKDQTFFDNLFALSIYSDPIITMGNKELAEQFELTVPQVDHALRRLSSANLINKKCIKIKTAPDKYTSSRRMCISNSFIAFLSSKLNNMNAPRMQSKLMEYKEKIYMRYI